MDEEIKKGLKNIAISTENKVAASILRWKHKREGKEIPDEGDLESQSRQITDQANRIISRRGKNIWNELKKAYRDGKGKEEDRD